MLWHFDSELPIYTQLVDRIKLAIAAGELAAGERMMTVRELALEAGVNPNTVQRALSELERQGLVYSQRGNGRFVTEETAVIDAARDALAREHVRRFRQAMRGLGCTEEEIMRLLEGSREEDENG